MLGLFYIVSTWTQFSTTFFFETPLMSELKSFCFSLLRGESHWKPEPQGRSWTSSGMFSGRHRRCFPERPHSERTRSRGLHSPIHGPHYGRCSEKGHWYQRKGKGVITYLSVWICRLMQNVICCKWHLKGQFGKSLQSMTMYSRFLLDCQHTFRGLLGLLLLLQLTSTVRCLSMLTRSVSGVPPSSWRTCWTLSWETEESLSPRSCSAAEMPSDTA